MPTQIEQIPDCISNNSRPTRYKFNKRDASGSPTSQYSKGGGVKKRYLGDRAFLKTQKVNSPLVSANLRFQEAFKGIRRLRKDAMGSNTLELESELLEED